MSNNLNSHLGRRIRWWYRVVLIVPYFLAMIVLAVVAGYVFNVGVVDPLVSEFRQNLQADAQSVAQALPSNSTQLQGALDDVASDLVVDEIWLLDEQALIVAGTSSLSNRALTSAWWNEDGLSVHNLMGEAYALHRFPLTQDVAQIESVVVAVPYSTSGLFAARMLSTLVYVVAVLVGCFVAGMLTRHLLRPILKIVENSLTLLPADPTQSMTTPLTLHDIASQLIITHQKIDQLSHLQQLFSRYVGDDIAQQILAGEQKLGGQEVWATAMFVDIRDFSTLMENSNKITFITELNEYYQRMQRVIHAFFGVIHKFGGDSILVLFGAPLSAKQHARSAILAAGAIMEEIAHFNSVRRQDNRPPMRVGIGVNTGEMVIGNVGSEQRLEFTALGDCVNTAKRLSDLSKDTPFYSIFAGQRTIDEATDLPTGWQVDLLGAIHVKGRTEPLTTYAITPDEEPEVLLPSAFDVNSGRLVA